MKKEVRELMQKMRGISEKVKELVTKVREKDQVILKLNDGKKQLEQET